MTTVNPSTAVAGTTPLRAAFRSRAVLVSLGLMLLIAVVWGVLALRESGPKSLDERTMAVGAQIQCPACQGESIADSSSPVALQMRGVVHEKLAEGWTDQQVLDYFRQTYGDTILESPPRSGFTGLIWVGPFVILLAGVAVVVSVARSWRSAPALASAFAGNEDAETSDAADLSDEERGRLLALLRREVADDEGLSDEFAREGRK